MTKRPLATEEAQHWTRAILVFLQDIGLPVEQATLGNDTFLPAVRVCSGGLVVDVEHAFPGDVLHEAGHLAVAPARYRHLADGNLKALNLALTRHLQEHGEGLMTYPEDPLCRACLQADEQSATAWQYAAAQHLGLPDRWLFPVNSYEGEPEVVLRGLKASNYMGINGLQAAGWTLVRANPARSLPVYPQLAFWLSP